MKTWADITRATNVQILAWAEAQAWTRDMATCSQDAQWHAEGDVWTHTKMVCAELEQGADWPSLDRAAQLNLLFTALFHDSGKPAGLEPDTAHEQFYPPSPAIQRSQSKQRFRISGASPREKRPAATPPR